MTVRRPRLLFLAQVLPWPLDGGVQLRTYHVLRLLAEEFDVKALCFYRRSAVSRIGLDASVAQLRSICSVEAFPIPQEQSSGRAVIDHLRSLATGRVYNDFVYDSGAFRVALATALQQHAPALVHVDSLDLSGYFPALGGRPVVCVHHNIESRLLALRAEVEVGPLRRAYVRHQSRLLANAERTRCDKVALNVVVSEPDRDALRRIAGDVPILVVPNGVDTEAVRPREAVEEGLVFVGGASWFPNRDAMLYFGREILTVISSRVEHPVRTRWLGTVGVTGQLAVAELGIEAPGFVDDVHAAIAESAVYVVPLRVGGGTRLKILEAWAMGKAVVSTSIGCEGLQAVDGENILIRDEPEAFAGAVLSLLSAPGRRAQIGAAARRTAVERYDWKVLGRTMLPAYEALAVRVSGPRP